MSDLYQNLTTAVVPPSKKTFNLPAPPSFSTRWIFLLTFLWMCLFCIGAVVDTNQLRTGSWQNLPPEIQILNFLKVLFAWVPTNVGFLAMLGGITGALSRRVLLKFVYNERDNVPAKQLCGGGGVAAGFVIYLATMAGAIRVSVNFEKTTPDSYFRLAAIVSFAAFGAGFRPSAFHYILDKFPESKGVVHPK